PPTRWTALSAAFAASTQSIERHCSSPRSAIVLAFSCQGFHTTVVVEPVFSTTIRRARTGSVTVHVPRVLRNTRSVVPFNQRRAGRERLAPHVVRLVDVDTTAEAGDRHLPHVADKD